MAGKKRAKVTKRKPKKKPIRKETQLGQHRPGTPSVIERVTLISRMMALGEWVPGKSGRELAERWGLSVHTIELASSEASRLVRRAVNPDAVYRHALVALTRIAETAEDTGDYKSAIGAIKLHLESMGLLTKQQRIFHSYEQLSDEELAEEIRRYIPEFEPKQLGTGETQDENQTTR